MRAGLRESGSGSAETEELPAGWPVLSDLVANLDAEVLRVVRAPRGSVPVHDVVILDRTEPGCVHPGAVVLAVGLSVTEGEALALVDGAGRSGAAGVVFRADEAVPPRLLDISDSLDLALFTVPVDMTWGQLYSLLRTALVSAGAVGESGAAGVPVGDLFGLADAIAAAVGGPVTIEDPQWRVLAYSSLEHPIDEARRQTILGRTPPLDWQRRLDEAGVARELRTGNGAVRFEGVPGDDLAPRLAAPIRAGNELLGSVWVAEADTPLGAAAEEELSRAAELAAIHMIAHRASDDVKRQTRGAFVREVLEGRVPAGRAAGAVPLRSNGPFTVMGFEIANGEARRPAASPERILSIISLHCEDVHADAMCAFVDERFWTLLPTPRDRPRERTLELGHKIAERVERALQLELSVGIGASVPGVADVPRSRRAAEQALQVLSRRAPAAGVVHIEDVQASAVLLELLEIASTHPSLLQGRLERLLVHDRDEGSDYAATLRVYLSCWGDATEAGRRMGIHPNTMRYRVRRITEISGIDLDDSDERFVTELQLRLLPVAVQA